GGVVEHTREWSARRRGCGGRRPRPREHEGDRGHEQRGRDEAGAHRHRASLTCCPACSVSASSLGFRRWIVASDTPVLIEIAESVSPDLTVYILRCFFFFEAVVLVVVVCCVVVLVEELSSLSSVLSTTA